MNREILFRGKRIDNGQWVEGGIYCGINTWIITTNAFGGFVYHLVDPNTVGQFTGLTDKNGKKIFEGDIVVDSGSFLYGPVVYATPQDGFDGVAGFMVNDVDDGLQNYNGFWHHVEVIGNIHDNPELLD